MRLVFAGSAEFSIPVLRALLGSPHQVLGVLTAPERAGSRGGAAPRPVRDVAMQAEVVVAQPTRLSAAAWEELPFAREAEALVVAAYGQLLPLAVLESRAQGGLGVHPSLLPRHRGATPVPAALLAGDSRAGVTVFRMDQRLDAGPIIAQQEITVPPDATAPQLGRALAELGAELLLRALDQLERGAATLRAQRDADASYCQRLSRRDGELDWSIPAAQLDRRLRALQPWPGVTVPLAGIRVKLLRGRPQLEGSGAPGALLAQLGEAVLVGTPAGAFRVDEIQPPGRPPMSPAAFLRGRPSAVGWTSRG